MLDDDKTTFAWKTLDTPWQHILLTNKFMITDCLPDGNCQFRSIETALIHAGIKKSHEQLRKVIASYINKISLNEFKQIIESYKLEQQHNEFQGSWDPSIIKTKKQFIQEITTPGFHFQGDHITLSLLSNALNIDFILFNDNYLITDLSNSKNLKDNIIILYFTNSHYQTIGLQISTKKIQTVFQRSNIPSELNNIIDRYTFLFNHVSHVYNNLKPNVTLNSLLSELKNNLTLSKSDISSIIKILRLILEQNSFFHQMN
jgi:hypothetical protein